MSTSVVLITGGLTGIGRAAAMAFAKEGAMVTVTGRREAAGAVDSAGQFDRTAARAVTRAASDRRYLPAKVIDVVIKENITIFDKHSQRFVFR